MTQWVLDSISLPAKLATLYLDMQELAKLNNHCKMIIKSFALLKWCISQYSKSLCRKDILTHILSEKVFI